MRTQGRTLGGRLPRRMCTLIAAGAALAAVGFGPTLGTATADTPAHTDVMLVFDTSGSMESVLTSAKQEVKEVIASVNATLPDVHYGVAEVRDFPGDEATAAESTEKPWKLDVPLTSDLSAVQGGIEPLFAYNGGDLPESYGRALWETDTNPNVGWRAGARHVIILVADNVPHDNDLDEGIPASQWVPEGNPAPWNTGEELPGAWGIPGTQMTPSVNRDFHNTLQELAHDGKPLGMVDFRGAETGYLPYWEYWASLTGGQALLGGAGAGPLATSLTTLIVSRATAALPACPTGQFRNAGGTCEVRHSTVAQVICNLVVATASDTCTATIGDAAPAGSTNPTGTVAFTSASGGVFSAGNTCALVATPLSPNVSSCSVQFLPPSTPSTLPAITATYAGDEAHIGSSAQTRYGAASELATHVDLSSLGTIRPDGTVEVPFECGFPCEVLGELLSGPDLSTTASVSQLHVGTAASSAAAKKHGKKKKKKKPVLLGKGTLKLSAPGKGKLIFKPTSKGKRALRAVKSKGVHVTLNFTIRTLNGTVVTTKKQRVVLRPKAKKKKVHKKHH